MEALAVVGIAASVAQLVHVTAHTSKLLKSTYDGMRDAPRLLEETHKYVQILEAILSMLGAGMAGGLASVDIDAACKIANLDQPANRIIEEALKDMKELEVLVAKISVLFPVGVSAAIGGPQAPNPTSGGSAPQPAPTSASTQTTSATGAGATGGAATGATMKEKLKQNIDRQIGLFKVFYKEDTIRKLKDNIERHISALSLIYNATGLQV